MTLREYIETFGMDERVEALAHKYQSRLDLRASQITLALEMKSGAEFLAILGGMGHADILNQDAEWVLRSVETFPIQEKDDYDPT